MEAKKVDVKRREQDPIFVGKHGWKMPDAVIVELEDWSRWLVEFPLVDPTFIQRRVKVVTDASTRWGFGMHIPGTGEWASQKHSRITRKWTPQEVECMGAVMAVAHVIEQSNGPTIVEPWTDNTATQYTLTKFGSKAPIMDLTVQLLLPLLRSTRSMLAPRYIDSTQDWPL